MTQPSNLRVLRPHATEGLDFLQALDDEYITCRAQKHDFPRLVPNRPLPKGARTGTGGQGEVLLFEQCPDCLTIRYRALGHAFGIEYGQSYKYDYSQCRTPYLAPAGANITKADSQREHSRRMGDTLRRQAGVRPKVQAVTFAPGA